MMNETNKYQIIMEDLKITLAAIDSSKMDIVVPNRTADVSGFVFINPQDHRVQAMWAVTKGQEYVDLTKKEFLRDTSLLSQLRSVIIVASVTKGSVTVSKDYYITIESKSMIYQFHGVFVRPDDIMIDIEL